MEQEFLVRPSGDLSKVQISYRGIDGLELAQDGSLLIHTAFGAMHESKPRLYQDIDGRRIQVEGTFKLTSNTTYTFVVGPHNAEYAVVIDPTLSYSTFLGGDAGYGLIGYGDENEQGLGIAVDSKGSAYVVGLTASTDFPTTTGSVQPTNPAPVRAFVTKLSPDGSQLMYSTYLGSQSTNSWGIGVAVNAAGEAYVTSASGAGFPTTANAIQQNGYGTYLAKLSAAGDALPRLVGIEEFHLQVKGSLLEIVTKPAHSGLCDDLGH